MKYNIIYADPPWSYRDKALAGNRGASCKYPVMSVEDIAALPVGELAAKDCLLAMWWVPQMPEEALSVVKAWGFQLITMKGFTWHKETSKNRLSHFGSGHWTRTNTEDCLFARRGRPKTVNRSVRQYISSVRREHSRKPDEARERLITLMGDLPRIELFAREKHESWHAWGNEVERDIEMGECSTWDTRSLKQS